MKRERERENCIENEVIQNLKFLYGKRKLTSYSHPSVSGVGPHIGWIGFELASATSFGGTIEWLSKSLCCSSILKVTFIIKVIPLKRRKKEKKLRTFINKIIKLEKGM